MESTKKSPQFTRTDKAITNALIHLLKDKPFEKITVQDILEETPVTRATFYAHFQDKYEIAERMQEEYFRIEEEVVRQLSREKRANYPAVIQQTLNRNRELVEALLKINTDRVNLRSSIAAELEKKYLNSSSSPTRGTEAKVYAQAMTAFQFACMRDNDTNCFSTDFINRVMVEVLLYILRINDASTREYLYQAIRRAEAGITPPDHPLSGKEISRWPPPRLNRNDR